MSYLSFDELETGVVTQFRQWVSNPLAEEVVIPERTVHFKERLTDTISFERDSPPSACSDPDVKFQVPCDTLTSSSSCYQSSRVFTLVR